MSTYRFVLRFSTAAEGGTNIEADERPGLGRGWWMPGLFGCLFAMLTMGVHRAFWPEGIAFLTFGGEGLGLVFSVVVTAFTSAGDRDRLTSLLERVADARTAA